jgi:hypothetical protein
MLSAYGIENAAIRIADRETAIFNIECPFIAHTGSDFVVVHKVMSFGTKKGEGSRER